MQWNRIALILGVIACIAVLGIIAVPYVLAPATGVNTYYDTTLVGPPVVGLITLFATITFFAGVVGRLSSWTIAGATFIFGIVMVVSAAMWAMAVPPHLVMGLSRAEELLYHRWVLVGFTLLVPVIAVLCARMERRTDALSEAPAT